ncbi:DUF6662 family protein [Microbulbifer hainanensis]|uniref:DUF6662 family protein n=1 Tax=Microbulbifer hainanensis TaxID=2735675 RepID=UPI0018683CD9|nr:DUF6662 family protein [Microbulbifer hainanensis]
MNQLSRLSALGAILATFTAPATADENLFGSVKGAETMPEGSWEVYQIFTDRSDKGTGDYRALDSTTEVEYGVSNKFTVGAGLKAIAVESKGLLVDGYIPGDYKRDLSVAGFEATAKYNFLSPALDDFGLSGFWEFDYMSIDPHSGRDKDTLSLESALLAQKYLLEGQLIWVGNLSMEGTYAKRGEINNLPAGFEWPTDPEMELEFKLGSGVSYRFAPNWFVGAEINYETEFETEVGQERWSVFAGPNLHYATANWWATLSWMPQLEGGGEMIIEGDDLHLIEKTKSEARLKLGYNF